MGRSLGPGAHGARGDRAGASPFNLRVGACIGNDRSTVGPAVPAGSGLTAAHHALLSRSHGRLPRLREDIGGQPADSAGQNRLGLGAEGG